MDLKDRFFIDCNKNKNCRVRIGSNCSENCCLAEVTSSNNIDQDMDVAALTKKYRKKDTICPETRMARRRVISPRVYLGTTQHKCRPSIDKKHTSIVFKLHQQTSLVKEI